MRVLVILFLSTLLLGCGFESATLQAQLQCSCPRDKPHAYQILIEAPADGWQMSGHGFALFQNRNTFSFHVPEQPKNGSVFTAQQIQAYRGWLGEPALEIKIVSGQISINLENKIVAIDLYDANGTFQGTGSYPITFIQGGASNK